MADQIVKIEMRYQQITDESILCLVNQKNLFEKLESIDFQCCDISGSSMLSFSDSIKTSNIRTLILSGNRLSSLSGVQLGRALANSSLEILELADCGLRNRLYIFRKASVINLSICPLIHKPY